MIYRDDDVSKFTDLTTILNIQKLFDKYNKIHTVTVLMEDLWESRGVWEFLMTAKNLDIALHGWNHSDFSEMTDSEIENTLQKCMSYWDVHTSRMGYSKKITTLFPPWNKINKNAEYICACLGLEINVDVNPKNVYNFHWWEFIGGRNLDKLERKLNEE